MVGRLDIKIELATFFSVTGTPLMLLSWCNLKVTSNFETLAKEKFIGGAVCKNSLVYPEKNSS